MATATSAVIVANLHLHNSLIWRNRTGVYYEKEIWFCRREWDYVTAGCNIV
jgi:hypothetical protein